jgi:hypothetical protein
LTNTSRRHCCSCNDAAASATASLSAKLSRLTCHKASLILTSTPTWMREDAQTRSQLNYQRLTDTWMTRSLSNADHIDRCVEPPVMLVWCLCVVDLKHRAHSPIARFKADNSWSIRSRVDCCFQPTAPKRTVYVPPLHPKQSNTGSDT